MTDIPVVTIHDNHEGPHSSDYCENAFSLAPDSKTYAKAAIDFLKRFNIKRILLLFQGTRYNKSTEWGSGYDEAAASHPRGPDARGCNI